jgi:DNA-binding PadR family transcriptional regulator
MARKPKNGPASDPELLILLSLAQGPKHGYAIMTDVLAVSDVRLGPGTLYTAITRLVERKLIAPETSAGRQRPYRITAHGSKSLALQLSEMRRVASIGLARLRTA